MNQLEAELFALTHRGHPGDLAFYSTVCGGVGNVLELGSGYGRLLPALSRAGRAVGLERDPFLLKAAREEHRRLALRDRRRIALVRGDMRSFALGQKFDRILLPYSGLYCLTTKRQLLACFKQVHLHLTESGRFIFDVWCADRFHQRAGALNHRDDTAPILAIGHRLQIWDVWERSRLNRRAQRLDVRYTYISRERGHSVEITIEQRYAPSSELVQLLDRAGFEVVSLHGDFAFAPFRASAAHVVLQTRQRAR